MTLRVVVFTAGELMPADRVLYERLASDPLIDLAGIVVDEYRPRRKPLLTRNVRALREDGLSWIAFKIASRVRGLRDRIILRAFDAIHGPRVAEQTALNLFCASSPLKGLRRSDDFVGFYFGGRLDETNLTTVLTGLPSGRTVELMCHPGHDEMQPAGDWQYAWAAERDALTSPRIRELVAARGMQLISYRDV